MSRREEKMSAFETHEESSLEEVADGIYGASEPVELETGRVVAPPTDIRKIWADVKQPRRAVPASIRMHWTGDPEDVPDLLGNWYIAATNRAGRDLDVAGLLQGRGEGIDLEGTPAIFQEYVALARLAQSIHQEGLLNPIHVIEQRGRYLIETGERRWLAYWLLHLTLGGYERIAAIRSDGRDYVWRQAQENTARRSLNAIGMARQLALLIMDSRSHLDGVEYDEYEMFYGFDACDRRYYAQVANGNTHRIPKGMGERIQAAMGLSDKQLSRYRNLLRVTEDEQINDALWIRADVEDWPEGSIRDVAALPLETIRDVLNSDGWTLEDLKFEANEILTSPNGEVPEDELIAPTEHQYKAGDKVLSPMGYEGVVVAAPAGGKVHVRMEIKGSPRIVQYAAEDLTPPPAPPHSDREGSQAAVFEVGEAVMVKATEEIGEIINVRGGSLTVDVNGELRLFLNVDVISLGMTFEEFLQDPEAHDPSFPLGLETPPLTPPHSDREGNVIGMPERGGVPGSLRVSEYYDNPTPSPSAKHQGGEQKGNSQAQEIDLRVPWYIRLDDFDAVLLNRSHEQIAITSGDKHHRDFYADAIMNAVNVLHTWPEMAALRRLAAYVEGGEEYEGITADYELIESVLALMDEHRDEWEGM